MHCIRYVRSTEERC